MSAVVLSAIAAVPEEARRVLRSSEAWPTASSRLASKILQRDASLSVGLFDRPILSCAARLLRRKPVLAAYGYVIDAAPEETVALWIEELEHLRGREIYPADRNSFIFDPVEILGVCFGVCSPRMPAAHRDWLAGTSVRGFGKSQFKTSASRLAALH
ncbi:hypothetical protein ACSHT2_06930 [Bradyrhizobium sp. PUT101]|uniref:hypothetical protein n=1 Tax=Bradyrhizobium sp. PUT101 TaxID=3447427 RepID=UPI003F85D586